MRGLKGASSLKHSKPQFIEIFPKFIYTFSTLFPTMFDYRLSKKEITILEETCKGGRSIEEIQQHIDLSYSRTSELLTRLESKGFISKSNTLKKDISISDREHAQKFCDLVKRKQHIDWKPILSESKAKILTQLCYMPHPKKLLSQLTLRSEKTIRYSLERPREIGILTKDNEITERFRPLCSFLNSWRRYYNIKFKEEIAPNATFLWQGGLEFIIETEREIDDDRLQSTAPSALAKDIFYTKNTYICSHVEQNIYEHILNTLTVRPDDKRVLEAVKKELEGLNVDRLISLAERYRKEVDTEKIKEMVD